MGRPPKTGPFPNRLRELRLRRGLSLERMAALAGSNKSSVSRFETGESRLTIDDARRFAQVLDVDPEELLPGRMRLVPVVGRVGAGERICPIDDHPKGEGLYKVECPRGLDPKTTVAVEITGESQLPIGDKWLAFYSRVHEYDAADVLGKLCVVCLTDGTMLLKTVRRGPTHGRFNLLSTNAPLIEDVELEWATPVRAILPPDLVQAAPDA